MKRLLALLLLALVWGSPAQATEARNIVLFGGKPRPVLDLNFASMAALDSRITYTRASADNSCTYFDAAGSTCTTFGTGVAPLTSRGLAVFEGRTNFLLNSTAPVTQTTASLSTGTYIFWCTGTGSVTSSLGTATATGVGALTCSQSTFQTIPVTGAGTLTFTVTGSVDRFQLEKGTTTPVGPTPFIVTTGTTAARVTPTIAIATSGFSYNANASTIAAKFIRSYVDSSNIQRIFSIDDGTTNEFASVRMTATTFTREIQAGGVSIVAVGAGTVGAVNTTQKVSFAWRLGNDSFAANGAVIGSDAPGSIPTVTTLRPGLLNGIGSQILNGWVSSLQYYNQFVANSALSNLPP